MVSRWRLMNYSFNPPHIVNTYGAFGSITRTRYEIVIEGSSEATVTDRTDCRAYEFKGKLERSPTERRTTGSWWTRRQIGMYVPPSRLSGASQPEPEPEVAHV